MIVSEKRIAANRRNALKSTGPRSPLGKFRSSRNGLKHGLYSKFDFQTTFQSLPPADRSRFLALLLSRYQLLVTGDKRRESIGWGN